MKTYDVTLSYPIKVKAEDEEHVKQIIMDNEHLGSVSQLKLEIKEVENGSK